jgi:hypothetical protein
MCFDNQWDLYYDTLAILEQHEIRKTRSRANVSGLYKKTPYGRQGISCRSQNFGVVYNRWKAGVSRLEPIEAVNNRTYPVLYNQLKKVIREIEPNFQYNTITVNHNLKCLPHYDKANKSPSLILTLGDFDGGRLIVEGCAIDIHWKPLIMNGSSAEHSTEEFTGERYSIIYYNI